MSKTSPCPRIVRTLPEEYSGTIINGQVNCCIEMYSVKVSGCASQTCFAYDKERKYFIYICPHFKEIQSGGFLPCYKRGRKLK